MATPFEALLVSRRGRPFRADPRVFLVRMGASGSPDRGAWRGGKRQVGGGRGRGVRGGSGPPVRLRADRTVQDTSQRTHEEEGPAGLPFPRDRLNLLVYSAPDGAIRVVRSP